MTSSDADNLPIQEASADESSSHSNIAATDHDVRAGPDTDGSDAGSARQHFTISELAAAFGVTARAIRFYEAKQLIAPERRGTARLYSRRDRARLQMILRGKNVGFSLEEIREFLDLYDADPTMTMQTRHLLGKVEVSIAELKCKRADIDRTLDELCQIRKECLQHLDD